MATDRKRELLVEELRQVVGDEAVERADLDFDHALQRQPSSLTAALRSSSPLLLVVGGALLVVGVVASLALESWIFFAVAIAAHALVATVVIGSALVLTADGEKPAPNAEAALEDDGVRDPSGALNDLVEQVEGRRARPS